MAGTATISWIGNPAPTGLAFTSNAATSVNNVTTPSLAGVAAGALMVMSCAAADDSATAVTVSITGTGLTWTRQINPHTALAHTGAVEIWTAPCPAGGSVSATCTWTGGTTNATSSVMYAFTGQEAVPAGASAGGEQQAAPSVAILTTRANSYLICVSSDWNATAGAKTYRDSATNVLDHDLSPGTYRGYHYYKATTSVTTYTEGISAPSTQASDTAVYEIRVP